MKTLRSAEANGIVAPRKSHASCDPLIGPNQKHALFARVTHRGFSDRRSRPFRINVFITPCSS
jgi:hypothetical protein